jgi:hypothetical protein
MKPFFPLITCANHATLVSEEGALNMEREPTRWRPREQHTVQAYPSVNSVAEVDVAVNKAVVRECLKYRTVILSQDTLQRARASHEQVTLSEPVWYTVLYLGREYADTVEYGNHERARAATIP